MAAEGFAFGFGLGLEPAMPWITYLKTLAGHRTGMNLPAGLVPQTLLVADVGGEIVGRTSIRYELNEFSNGKPAILATASFPGTGGAAMRAGTGSTEPLPGKPAPRTSIELGLLGRGCDFYVRVLGGLRERADLFGIGKGHFDQQAAFRLRAGDNAGAVGVCDGLHDGQAEAEAFAAVCAVCA